MNEKSIYNYTLAWLGVSSWEVYSFSLVSAFEHLVNLAPSAEIQRALYCLPFSQFEVSVADRGLLQLPGHTGVGDHKPPSRETITI